MGELNILRACVCSGMTVEKVLETISVVEHNGIGVRHYASHSEWERLLIKSGPMTRDNRRW